MKQPHAPVHQSVTPDVIAPDVINLDVAMSPQSSPDLSESLVSKLVDVGVRTFSPSPPNVSNPVNPSSPNVSNPDIQIFPSISIDPVEMSESPDKVSFAPSRSAFTRMKPYVSSTTHPIASTSHRGSATKSNEQRSHLLQPGRFLQDIKKLIAITFQEIR